MASFEGAWKVPNPRKVSFKEALIGSEHSFWVFILQRSTLAQSPTLGGRSKVQDRWGFSQNIRQNLDARGWNLRVCRLGRLGRRVTGVRRGRVGYGGHERVGGWAR